MELSKEKSKTQGNKDFLHIDKTTDRKQQQIRNTTQTMYSDFRRYIL